MLASLSCPQALQVLLDAANAYVKAHGMNAIPVQDPPSVVLVSSDVSFDLLPACALTNPEAKGVFLVPFATSIQ